MGGKGEGKGKTIHQPVGGASCPEWMVTAKPPRPRVIPAPGRATLARTSACPESDGRLAKDFFCYIARCDPVFPLELQALIKSAGMILPTHIGNSGVVVSTRKKPGHDGVTR